MNTPKNKVYSEVYSILNLLGDEYITKLPSQLYKMIKKKRDSSYYPKYDMSVSINEQNISEQALAIITLFNLKCWSDEDGKEIIKKKLDENDKIYQTKMENMYDLSFLIEKRNNVEEKTETRTIIVHKENLFEKIINKLRSFFHKKK